MLDYLSRVLNFERGKKHKKGININWPAMGCPVCFLNVVFRGQRSVDKVGDLLVALLLLDHIDNILKLVLLVDLLGLGLSTA